MTGGLINFLDLRWKVLDKHRGGLYLWGWCDLHPPPAVHEVHWLMLARRHEMRRLNNLVVAEKPYLPILFSIDQQSASPVISVLQVCSKCHSRAGL